MVEISYDENELGLIIADNILQEYGISIWGYANEIAITDKEKFYGYVKQSIKNWCDNSIKEE